MFRIRMMATAMAVLLQGCASTPPTAIGRNWAGADDGPGAANRWSVWTEAMVIPDADHRGILLGPIVTNDDAIDLRCTILRLDLRHPATGDLDIRLAYDADGDGVPEISTPIEFFRSRSDPSAGELHACPQALDGTYFFRDSAGEEEQVFAAFRSLPPGHAFYLAVADTLEGDSGNVLSWAIRTETSAKKTAR